jgi:parallel beta helix pectate lyase-like protein
MAGSTIRLEPGEYVFEKPILLQGMYHLNIVGSGWNTTLRMAGPGDLLVLDDCHFGVIRDLMIDYTGGGKKGSGILYRGTSSSNTVAHCRIQRFPVSGIRFEGNAKQPMSTNSVRDCHFISNAGAQLWSHHSNDFFILGNQFGAHGGVPEFGAVLDHSSAGTYSMNYHWDNVVGLHLGPGSSFNRIENNRFEESRRQGILIGDPKGGDGCYETIILGNTIHTNSKLNSGKYPAVEAFDAQDVVFSNNQVFSWNANTTRHTSAVVAGRNCRSWIIKDNIFRNHTQEALVLEHPDTHIVKGNLADAPAGGTTP